MGSRMAVVAGQGLELPPGAKLCGAYADHVDHIATRLDNPGSALSDAGSTRRWRRIRAWVLNRDGGRCQLLVDEAGDVVETPRPLTPPAGPDDPAWLRATCPRHNLARGAASTDARPTNNRQQTAGRWDW